MKKGIILLLAAVFAVSTFAQETKKITLEDILVKETFKAQTITGLQPTKDGEHYTVLEKNSQIVKYSCKTGSCNYWRRPCHSGRSSAFSAPIS